MGMLAPLGSIVPQVVGTIGAPVLGTLANSIVNNSQSDYDAQRLNLQMAQSKEDAAARVKEIELNAKLAEEERLRNLRSAIAKQRASFGASGFSSESSGSAQAVLTGFLSESEEDKKARDRVDALKKQAINDSLSQGQQVNLLKLSELEDKQSFGNAISDIL